MRKILLLIACMASIVAMAQTTKEELRANLNKTGGVYYAYPTEKADNTPAPKGYEPFYISHYGRHGSRYLISDDDYYRVLRLLGKASDADALTPLGDTIYNRLKRVWAEVEGRGGDLTPLGVRQHRGIAERMATNYPEVFRGDTKLSARSTLVVRCVLSMAAFCERLKEINPKLQIDRDASQSDMYYMCYHSPESNAYTSDKGPWKEEYRKFEESHVNADRIVKAVFSDPEFIKKNVNPKEFMWGLYWIAVDMQNIESTEDFFEAFTPDELIDVWQCVNYGFYVRDASYAGNFGLPVRNARNLLNNIVATADSVIAKGDPAATLRFGHDGNLIPLAAIMKIKDCYESISEPERFYEVFSDFKIAPMAGNIQLVFFKNKKNPAADILVKVLHNEKEVELPVTTDKWPYYRWADVRKLFLDQCE